MPLYLRLDGRSTRSKEGKGPRSAATEHMEVWMTKQVTNYLQLKASAKEIMEKRNGLQDLPEPSNRCPMD